MAIDPHPHEEADEQERERAQRRKETDLGRACEKCLHREELQRDPGELVPELRYALTNPEFQEVRMVPQGRRGQAMRAHEPRE